MQQQPTQYPPQPQFYQQPPQPPKKHNLFWLWLIIGLLVGFGLGYAAHVTPSAQPPTTPTIQATTQDTPTTASQPTSVPTSTTNQVGSPVTSGPWQITINNAKTSTGNDITTPTAGNTYLIINFTAKNTATSTQSMNPFDFTLRDASGTTYNYTVIELNNNPDGTVVAGQQLRADLAYEVPKSLHSFTLQFDPADDFDQSQIVQWTITT